METNYIFSLLPCISDIKHQQNNFLWTEAVNLKSREERALAAWTGWRWSTNTKSNGSGWIGSVKVSCRTEPFLLVSDAFRSECANWSLWSHVGLNLFTYFSSSLKVCNELFIPQLQTRWEVRAIAWIKLSVRCTSQRKPWDWLRLQT